MPVFATFLMIWWLMFCFNVATLNIIEFGFGIKIPHRRELYIFVPIVVTVLLYWRMVCGKRYIRIIRNPKYYSKSSRILTWYIFVGCFIYFVLADILRW